jgi:hypothetical protein
MSTPARRGHGSPGDVVVEFRSGPIVRIAAGTSLTIGSGPQADCRIQDESVAPLHARIDNRVVPPGYDASHPYCGGAWVADIGGASIGEDLFGPKSRTGVVRDPQSGFVMPLECGEVAPLHTGTIVLLGTVQLRVVSGA